MHVVVTGANRGIGLTFVTELLARGDSVDAAVRDPARAEQLSALLHKYDGKLRILACDVASAESVRAFARSVGEVAVDMLINNAGVMGEDGSDLAKMDFDDVLHTFNVNAVGVLRVTSALLPNVLRGEKKLLLHITSGLGSIGDNVSGGYYGYRMSKAALNMASRSLAVDLREHGVISIVINPGWVRTDMGGPGAAIGAHESVASMLRHADRATLAQSGRFLNWRGGEYPW